MLESNKNQSGGARKKKSLGGPLKLTVEKIV